MSYILEALKKAQAERQLGSAPTIHAPAVHVVPAGRASPRPVMIGIAGGALVLATAAVFIWRQQAAAPVAAQSPAAAPLAAAAPAASRTSQSAPAPLAEVTPAANDAPPGAPAPQVALLADPAPAGPVHKVPAAPMPAKAHATPPVATTGSRPVAEAAPVRATAARLAEQGEPMAARTSAPMPAPAPAVAVEETVRPLNELPEAVRRELPRVSFGGYLYSPNPADRLLLVDKTLRHEGEEVAPGLVLERLLPKAAVMNYKGFRYRVPY